MIRPLRAGVLAAALLMLPVPAFSQQARGVDLPHIKAALRITPAQQRYWAPVEAVLTDIAQRQVQQQSQASVMQRMRQRVVTVVLDSAAVARLSAAARPLVQVLTDDQKRAAQQIAREMGLGGMLASLR